MYEASLFGSAAYPDSFPCESASRASVQGATGFAQYALDLNGGGQAEALRIYQTEPILPDDALICDLTAADIAGDSREKLGHKHGWNESWRK